MQLTAHTDYALRVLIYLAINTEKRVTITELADFFGISRNHLVKVVHKLGVKGFVLTVRGKGGGICLSRPAREISVGNVVREVEGHFQMAECFNPKKQGSCALEKGCGLIGLLGGAVEQFLQTLDKAVLSDLVSQPSAQQLVSLTKLER
ncbi:Rrf2 family transcriptional regulator [Methylomonas sp. BW4-1]|uniref:Rrf2 family transcriptional regulator n=1 Tax=Methylomonas sp. BW4-1 TaxID=3376685 RepID=UPI004042A203